MEIDKTHKQSFKRYSGHIFAASEQIIYSGSNFSATILIAIFLNLSEFGIFAALYSGVMFSSILHSSFIGEPTLVLGGEYGKKDPTIQSLIYNSLKLWVIIGLTIFTLISCFYALFSLTINIIYNSCFLTLAWVGYGFFWTMKYILYLHKLTSKLLILSLVYGTLMLIGLIFIEHLVGLTAITAIGITGLAAFLAAIFGYIFYYKDNYYIFKTSFPIKTVFPRWISYGRWASLVGLSNWTLNNALLVLLPLLGLPEAGGILKLGLTLLMPLQQIINTLSTFSIPDIKHKNNPSREANLNHLKELKHWTILAGCSGLVVTVTIWLLKPVGYSLFTNSNYLSIMNVLPILALLPPFWAVNSCLRAFLKAYEITRSLTAIYFSGAIIVCCIPFTYLYIDELYASCIGLVFANLIISILLAFRTKNHF